MVRVRRARFICCTAGSEHCAAGLIVILPSAIIAPKSFDLIALAYSSNSGLNGLVRGGASFRLFIWQHPYQCEAGIVVNVYYEMLVAAEGGSREWTAWIWVYQLKGLRSALDLDSNELLLVLGLDAHSAHRIVVRVFRDKRSH